VWLLLFFVVPFVIVLKISFSDIDLAIPPYKPLLEWVGKHTLAIKFELRQLRVLVHRFAVSACLLELDQGGVHLDRVVFDHRLPDGLWHRARQAEARATCCCCW
jgi:hypothetical protein